MKHLLILILVFFTNLAMLQAQDADVYIMTGNAKDQLGDLQGALADYTTALQGDSTYAMAYFNRAWVKRKLNDYEGALADYTSAIRFKPRYEIAYNNRGIVYMLLGQKENACMDWETAWSLGYPDAKKLLETFCYTKPEDPSE